MKGFGGSRKVLNWVAKGEIVTMVGINLREEVVLVTPEQGGARQGKKEEEEEGGKSDKERNKPRSRRSLGDSGARRGAARQGRQGRRQSNPQSWKYTYSQQCDIILIVVVSLVCMILKMTRVQIAFRAWVQLMNCNHSSSGRSKVEIDGKKSNQAEVIGAMWSKVCSIAGPSESMLRCREIKPRGSYWCNVEQGVQCTLHIQCDRAISSGAMRSSLAK